MPQDSEARKRSDYLMTTIAAVRQHAQDAGVVTDQLYSYFASLWGLPLAPQDKSALSHYLGSILHNYQSGQSDLSSALTKLVKLADAAMKNSNAFYDIIGGVEDSD